jgi:hypothetical protein
LPRIASASAPSAPPKPKGWLRTVLRFFLLACLALFLFVVALILNNNLAVRSPSKAQFASELDRGVATSTQWMSEHRKEVMGNPPLMHMVGDMAAMSNQPAMQQIVSDYVSGKLTKREGRKITWYYARMADGVTEVPVMTVLDLAGVNWQDRLDAFGVAPHKVELAIQERADLFSPSKFHWGTRLHQLIALDVYRRFNGPTPELEAVINPVSEAVALEAIFDFRVNDMYLQRIWALFGAGRPDLVRKKWVLQLLAYQHPDGTWPSCWYGWCRGAFDFSLGPGDPAHVSVQGAYALYLIKYRYPQWIDENFK